MAGREGARRGKRGVKEESLGASPPRAGGGAGQGFDEHSWSAVPHLVTGSLHTFDSEPFIDAHLHARNFQRTM